MFRKFTEYGAASRDEATLRYSGNLFFSRSILMAYNIENPQFAALYIDEEQIRLGIRFYTTAESMPTDENYIKVSVERSGYTINIQPVLRYFRIKDRIKKSKHSVSKEDGLLVISLNGIRLKG